MKYTMVGMTILFSSLALAQDLNFQQYRKFLMNGNQGAGGKMAIQTTCTTAAGQTYRIGEKGYDACLANLKKQHDMKQLSGGKDSAAPGSPAPGAGASIHFGN